MKFVNYINGGGIAIFLRKWHEHCDGKAGGSNAETGGANGETGDTAGKKGLIKGFCGISGIITSLIVP